MRNKTDFNQNNLFLFNEEVPEKDLVDKKNHNDLVYYNSNSNDKKIKHLVVLAILLITVSLVSCFFGIILSEKSIKSHTDVYNLYVTHSNAFYGAKDIDIKNYDSDINSFEYSFTVVNKNQVNLDYSIEFINPNFNTDGINMGLINYGLFRDNNKMVSGSLANKSKYNIHLDSINANSKYVYTLKLWSKDGLEGNKFSFKINVVI